MRFDVSLPRHEQNQLAAIIGQQLKCLATDGWAIYLTTDACELRVIPEEVPTPDLGFLCGCMTRPKIAEPVGAELSLIAANLGTIVSIYILKTIASFTSPSAAPVVWLTDTVSVGGIEFGLTFVHPDLNKPILSDRNTAELDIAIEVQTSLGNRVFVYTDGIGCFVFSAINEHPIAPDIFSRTKLEGA